MNNIRRITDQIAKEKQMEVKQELAKHYAGSKREGDYDITEFDTSSPSDTAQARPIICFHFSMFYLRVLCQNKKFLRE